MDEDCKKYVVLVDNDDHFIGNEQKLSAHRGNGKLHRALSVFIFNNAGEMLIQRRAAGKYHFAGLLSNACCTHACESEDLEITAHRRLQEELGFDTSLKWCKRVSYFAKDSISGYVEREIDHVFVGRYDGAVNIDPNEIDSYQYTPVEEILSQIMSTPALFTPWFCQILSDGGVQNLLETLPT